MVRCYPNIHKARASKYLELRRIKKVKSPQSQKNHSTIKLEAEQVEVKVLFVNYQSLVQNQPANNEAYDAKSH
jgi:hypothetical protein